MALNLDPVYVVNLLLCLVIFVLGYWGYSRRHDLMPLLIALAFALFGISHLIMILDLKDLESALIAIRVLAYLLVVFALYRYVTEKTGQKQPA